MHNTTERIVSRNAFCESVLLTDADTGKTRFLKRSVNSNQFPDGFIQRSLEQSFESQLPLSPLIVNKVVTFSSDDGHAILEYPYLNPAAWQPFGAQDISSDPQGCLTAICLALDYLHRMDLVHLDVKASNVLINRQRSVPRVRLVDLDFLRPSGSACGGTIFGTLSHIAPEIVRDERAFPETDNFSFGVALKSITEECRASQNATLSHNHSQAIEMLADALCSEDRQARPRFLLDRLRSLEIIGESLYKRSTRRLLRLLFLSKYRQVRSVLNGVKDFMAFLHSDVKLVGIPTELIELCAEALVIRPQDVVTVFKKLLTESPLNTVGAFFVLSPEDALLEWAYQSLDQKHQSLSLTLKRDTPIQPQTATAVLEYVLALKASGKLDQSLVLGNQLSIAASDGQKALRIEDMLDLQYELGHLAYRVNRLAQADKFLRRVVESNHDSGRKITESYRLWVLVNLGLGKVDTAAEIVHQGLIFANSTGNIHLGLQLRRLSAWIELTGGKIDDAEIVLNDVFMKAEERGHYDVSALASYSISVCHWKRGQHTKARQQLAQALDICEKNGCHEQMIPILSTLSLVLNEVGAFAEALRCARRAADLCDVYGTSSQVPSICLSAVFANTRLARHESASEWLQRYLIGGRHRTGPHYLLAYYQALAFSLLNQGKLAQAADTCLVALSTSAKPSDAKLRGKLHQTLAEIHLMTGEIVACDRQCQSASQLFKLCGDTTSEREVALISSLASVLYSDTSNYEDCANLIRSLIACKCTYSASMGAYLLFLRSNSIETSQYRSLLATVCDDIKGQETPLYRAVQEIIHTPERDNVVTASLLPPLRSAFAILNESNHYFLAMLTALKIADQYRTAGFHKHCLNFLQQAQLLAERLGNQYMIKLVDTQLRESTDLLSEARANSKVLVSISNILSERCEFQTVADELLRFAVQETGAERGVLLLRKADATSLGAVASFNCDHTSVKDVIDFSISVPASAFSTSLPAIVKDALLDERTKSYRSIVLHNIRSIIAMPLVHEGEPLGVLYLDHHGIPSLFSDEDINYVSAIAKFITVALINAREYRDLGYHRAELSAQLVDAGLAGAFVTRDPVMLRLLSMIPMVARQDTSVLIVGESGTGKEILCHMIHEQSKRKNRPLVKINCAAIASSMIESELFGVARGAATGVAARDGKFSAADDGTLYLDEIGDMPLDVQAKVLRVLEYQQFEKVGSNYPQTVDVRFIYATNKNLATEVKQGKFRNDLLHRINAIAIEIPPLRERPSDIPLLLSHFSKIFARGQREIQFTPEAVGHLVQYDWPGNVRELRNVVERFSVLYPGQSISVKLLPSEMVPMPGRPSPTPPNIQKQEAEYIRSALLHSGWNRSKAAVTLGLPLTTLRRKIKKLGIRPPL